MIGKFGKLSVVLGGIVLAGCSETSFKDAFDMGKVAPDETQVQQNRALTMPPDLQLRAPGGGASGGGAGQTAIANNGPAVSTQPPQYGSVPQNGAQPQYTPPPQPRQASAPTGQPAAPVQDVYARNGISRLRPDGTPKTNEELIVELRALKQKRQQVTNPNYGTVFNLPKVWADGG